MGNCEQPPHHNFSENSQAAVFNPFFQANQSGQEHQILDKYSFISNYSDIFLGRCSVLNGKRDGNLYLSKEMVLNSQEQLQKAFEVYAQKRDKQIYNQNILRIKQVFISKTDGFFTDHHKIILILEYPLVSLKKQFNNRLLNRLHFQTQEIKDIMLATITAYAAIQKSVSNTYAHKSNDKIRMAHIFIGVQSKKSLIKVIDSEILPGCSNLQTLSNQGVHNQHQDIYLAPEELCNLTNDAIGGTLPNSGVFALGLTILDLCLMNSSSTLYHYNKKKLDQPQLKNLIKIAGKNHNIKIEKILNLMLEMNSQRRPSFSELQTQIINQFNNQTSELSSLRLSVVKNQAEFIKNDGGSLKSRSGSSRKGSVYQSQSLSQNRVYSSNIKKEKPVEEHELENIHEEYTNGNQYIGQKKNFLKHGKGKYIFKDRSYYEGNWKNNMMHGKGTLYYPNGKVEYKGEWKEDEPNGWGQMYSYEREGAQLPWKKYQGSVLKGQMHGQGKLSLMGGSTFEGQFFGNKILGKGRLTNQNGSMVERQWTMQTIEQFVSRQRGMSEVISDVK